MEEKELESCGARDERTAVRGVESRNSTRAQLRTRRESARAQWVQMHRGSARAQWFLMHRGSCVRAQCARDFTRLGTARVAS